MAKKNLTQRSLEALKPPSNGQYDVYDLGGPAGFHVRVSAGGTKTFALLYRRGGVKRKWTIGRFPSVSLAEARDKAKRADVLKEDPQKTKVELRRAGTFTSLMAAYFRANRRKLKPRTLREWLRIAKVELQPELGAMKPHEITRGDLRDLLDRKAQKAPYMANRILEVIRRVYSWGVKAEKVTASPCIGLEKPGGVEPERERVLSTDELKAVLKALDTQAALEAYAPFFRLALLTAARKSELLEMKWSDVDFDAKLWTLPDTKMGRSHALPLSTAAVSILEALPRESDYVFRNEFRITAHPKKGITRLRKLTRLDFRIHDLRRTTSSGLAQLGVREEVISAVLNHVSGPASTRIYQRHKFIPEMRQALERWSQELERIEDGKPARVVGLARA